MTTVRAASFVLALGCGLWGWPRMTAAPGAPTASSPNAADRALAEYFLAEATELRDRCLADVNSLDDWQAQRERRRRELLDMLGLWPLPERTDLRTVVTGRLEQEDFAVEKLHFQSLPGLYVTANLYLPKGLRQPAPAVLYVCGHSLVKTNGVSFGNKVAYQHHGIWFARHGYVCLLIDTLQLGEIEGLHHGTYREGLWWWNARGYTPAGVEAWNSLRALDYLCSRPEVDRERIGMTGRSGGGSYTWTTAALDERVKVAAPVAGITDLQNHVVDGCVEGHCDCMYFVNTYRWDFPLHAALLAPRPLLIVNTDADSIFPLDGVQRLHAKVKRIYDLYGASANLGLVIGPGPHKDTQDLQVPVFRWFNQHLKGEDPLIEDAAVKRFSPEQLKVFATLPADQINTRVHEVFVPAAKVSQPETPSHWAAQRQTWLAELRAKCFGGWPADAEPLRLVQTRAAEAGGLQLRVFEFTSQAHVRLPLFVLSAAGARRPRQVSVTVTDPRGWEEWAATWGAAFPEAFAPEGAAGPPSPTEAAALRAWARELKSSRRALVTFAPRGIGPTAWSGDARKQVHLRRRFMLLGQTLAGMQVWDVRRALQAARELPGLRDAPLTLTASGEMSLVALYASLFEPPVQALELEALPHSHRDGPDLLNVLRVFDVPQALAMAAERSPVCLLDSDPADAEFAQAAARQLGWGTDRVRLEGSRRNPSPTARE